MHVIGIAGQCLNGKDSIADRLQERLNHSGGGWCRRAFASQVKKVYCDTFGVDMAFVEKWKVVPEPPPGFDMPVRQGLQFIGDGFRRIKATIWLDLAFRDRNTPVIISDVRYPNEFIRVKQEGGMNVLVGRPDKLNDDPNGSEALIRPYVVWAAANLKELQPVAEQITRIDDPTMPEHMGVFDVFVINGGTKQDLMDKVDGALTRIASAYKFAA